MGNWGFGPLTRDANQQFLAALEMVSRFELTHTRPDFGITEVSTGNQGRARAGRGGAGPALRQASAFCQGYRCAAARVLVVAPLSGHFSTLLAGTVKTLLQDHDVYITDWANARDVPLSEGHFGVEDYITYIIRFLEEIGRGRIFGVCQPCVQALCAVAVMSEENHPATPKTMTLMAGPSIRAKARPRSRAWP